MRTTTYILLLLTLNAQAATYYIDYAGGSDANNGTATNTAWMRHPYMIGATNSYSHVAGDRFIFKGGVTWPSNCWPMHIHSSGTAGNRDYYGVQADYHAGTSWGYPVFDAGLRTNIMQLYVGDDNAYNTIDGIEFINAMQAANIEMTRPSHTTITNCYIHKWYHNEALDTWNENSAGIRNFAGSSYTDGYTNLLVTHCVITNGDGDGNCGSCVVFPSEVAFCKLADAPNHILFGGNNIHDNEIWHNHESYSGDGPAHPDVLYWANLNGNLPFIGDCYFYNNWIHDIRGGSGVLPVIYVEPGFGPQTFGEFYIYNNVVTACTNPPIHPYNEQNAIADYYKVHIWNNTFDADYGVAIHSSVDTVNMFDLLDCRNNHIIGPTAESDDPVCFNTYTTSNAVIQTYAAAVAQGFSRENKWMPVAGGSTIDAGVNLSSYSSLPGFNYDSSVGGTRIPRLRPTSGAWDVGAYELLSPKVSLSGKVNLGGKVKVQQ